MNITMYHFTEHGDPRGKLVSVETGKDIPFPIRRVYYMYGVGEGIRRGFHAHKKLEQVLICMHGSCKILLDDGKEKAIVPLDSPNEGLYVGNAMWLYVSNIMWREMFDFSPDAVLVVLASELYDEADYIRNYDDFLAYLAGQKGESV